MKAKQIFTFVLIIALLTIIVTACSLPKEQPTETPSEETTPNIVTPKPSTPSPLPTPTEPTATPEPEIFYPLENLAPFSEDRAWVQYYPERNTCITALIDTTGEVLFSTDMNVIDYSPFVDGLSYCIVRMNSPQLDLRYMIIDKSGEIISSTATSVQRDHDYVILGYTNGHFIVAEHIVNFNTDEWYIGTIDSHGNVINELQPCENINLYSTISNYQSYNDHKTGNRTAFYVGDGIIGLIANRDFKLGTGEYLSGLYDTKTNSSLSFNYSRNENLIIFGKFYDGQMLVKYDKPFDNTYYMMSSDYLTSDLGDENIFTPLSDTSSIGLALEFRFSEGLGNNLYSMPSAHYINVEGVAVTIEGHPDYEGLTVYGLPFKGDYAILNIIGADGYVYVTAINKAGTIMYEPVKTDINSRGAFGHVSNWLPTEDSTDNGYVCTKIKDILVIITPKGDIIPVSNDLSSIDNNLSITYVDPSDRTNRTTFVISGNWIINDNTYTSLDGSVIIDSVK